MAYISEGLNAFLGQPIEKKRSDHRLKSVESSIDTRAWALDEKLRQQHFLNVVSNGVGAGDGREGAEEEVSILSADDGVTGKDNKLLQDTIQKLEGDKEFLKNVVADKEGEIEQLLYRIRAISEDLQALLESQGSDPEEQKKLLERRISSHRDSLQNELERLQDHVEKMKEKLNEANATIADLQRELGLAQKGSAVPEKADDDDFLKNAIVDKDNEIEQLLYRIREFSEDLQTLVESPRDDDEKRDQLERDITSHQKSMENEIERLRDQVEKLQDKLNASNQRIADLQKDLLNEKEGSKSLFKEYENISPETYTDDQLKTLLNEKDNELKELYKRLENEQKVNDELRTKLDTILANDENNMKNKILEMTTDLEKIITETQEDSENIQDKEPNLEKLDEVLVDELKSKINELENLLKHSEELNDKLNKDLENERKKLNSLVGVDDSELNKLLLDAEKDNSELKSENDNLKKQIEDLQNLKRSPDDEENYDEDKLKQQLKERTSELMACEKTVHKLDKDIANLQLENENLKKKLGDLENLQNLPASDELRPEVDKSLTELKDLEEENKILKDKLANFAGVSLDEYENLRMEADNLKEKLKTANEKNVQLSNDLTLLKQQQPTLLADNDSDNKLKQQLKDVSSELKSSENNVDKLTKENDDLKRENSNLKDQIKDLTKSDLADAFGALPEEKQRFNENENLQQQIINLKDELNTANDNNLQLRKDLELAKAQQQPASVSGDDTELKRRLADAEKEIEKLRSDKESDAKWIQELKDAAAPPRSDESNIDKLAEENTKLKTENNNLKKQIEDLQNLNVRTTEESTLNNAKQLEQLKYLQDENDKLKDSLTNYESKSQDNNESLQQQVDKLKAEQKLRSDKDNDDKIIQDLKTKITLPSMPDQAALETMKNEIESLREQLKNKNDKNVELQRDLELLQRQMKAFESGEEWELNKMVIELRNELDNMKASKEDDNQKCRDTIAQKDLDIKHLKDLLNKKENSQILPINIETERMVKQDRELNEKSIKDQNEREKIPVLGSHDDNVLKKSLLDAEEEIQQLKMDRDEMDRLIKENNDLKLENSELKKIIEDLKQRKSSNVRPSTVQNLLNDSNQQAENNRLRESFKNYESGLEKEIHRLQEQVKKLQDQLNIKNQKDFKDEETQKLNIILQKAIRSGLKSLLMDELEFVHDALNNTVSQRLGREESIDGRQSSEILQLIVNAQEQRINSLLNRLDSYRKHNNNMEKTIMSYSNKVQRLTTALGLLELKVESLEHELNRKSFLVSHEQDKANKLQDMLNNVLGNCKCTRNLFALHLYRSIIPK